MKVLLTTEGTFPYSTGGVSTWALSLMSGLAHHEFAVAALTANPPPSMMYRLPPNAAVLPVPLWGLDLVEEFVPASRGARRRRRTTASAIGTRFLPLLELLLDQVLVAVNDPADVAGTLAGIAQFAESHDLRKAMQDERVWALVHQRLLANSLYRHVKLGEAIGLARSLYRYLLPLTVPIPDVDVVHASAAAFCVLPALAAKVRLGIPLVLTEHGIYVRERILELVRRDASTLEKVMFSNLYRAIAQAAYHVADLVAPVCRYNVRWETELGLAPRKVRVIYNGVDPDRFSPAADGASPGTDERRPTVAWVGRIQPLKDLLNLIRAIRIVSRSLPRVVCRIFGPDSDPDYAAQCRDAAEAAGLAGIVRFEGPTTDAAAAYREADLVVLSSMSEGFPYTVVEAMMCARPVVATDVGGVAEALDDESLLAEPQNASSLADAIVRQLSRPRGEREALGARLRERAVANFTEQRFLHSYDDLYRELDVGVH